MPMHESHLNPLIHKGHPSKFPYRGFLYKCIWEMTFGYHFKTVKSYDGPKTCPVQTAQE